MTADDGPSSADNHRRVEELYDIPIGRWSLAIRTQIWFELTLINLELSNSINWGGNLCCNRCYYGESSGRGSLPSACYLQVSSSSFSWIIYWIELNWIELNRYQAEDEDELSLEVGDVVQVVEYEDPEEQVSTWMPITI